MQHMHNIHNAISLQRLNNAMSKHVADARALLHMQQGPIQTVPTQTASTYSMSIYITILMILIIIIIRTIAMRHYGF